jgi:hypothetical protein
VWGGVFFPPPHSETVTQLISIDLFLFSPLIIH